MATYTELLQLASNVVGAPLRDKILVACVVSTDVIRLETPGTQARRDWAKQVLLNPSAEAQRMTWAVLAQNRAATVSQIANADDATVQGAVNNAIDLLANGG